MIQLYSKNLLIRDSASGALASLDTMQWRRRLQAAFASCGLTEEWIADNLVEVLERRVRACSGMGLECSTTDIERCLQTVLNDTGFRDVALAFTWNTPPPETPPALAAAGAFQPELLDCADLPPQLQLRTRYIRASDWELECDDTSASLLQQRTLRLLPVSDIIPIAIVDCDLRRLLPPVGESLFELEFSVRLAQACGAARAILRQLYAQMRRTWPQIIHPGTHLRFLSLRGLPGADAQEAAIRDPAALSEQIGQCLKAIALPSDCQIPFSYSLRP